MGLKNRSLVVSLTAASFAGASGRMPKPTARGVRIDRPT